jgi:hypothetical protein
MPASHRCHGNSTAPPVSAAPICGGCGSDRIRINKRVGRLGSIWVYDKPARIPVCGESPILRNQNLFLPTYGGSRQAIICSRCTSKRIKAAAVPPPQSTRFSEHEKHHADGFEQVGVLRETSIPCRYHGRMCGCLLVYLFTSNMGTLFMSKIRRFSRPLTACTVSPQSCRLPSAQHTSWKQLFSHPHALTHFLARSRRLSYFRGTTPLTYLNSYNSLPILLFSIDFLATILSLSRSLVLSIFFSRPK